MALPLEQPVDQRSPRTKSDLWSGILAGLLGLVFMYRGVILFFDPSSSHTARALPMGILLLLIAAQQLKGASREARLWLVTALFLIPGADVVLASARILGESFRWNVFWWPTAFVLLAVLVLLIAVRRPSSVGERP
jgi:uncharacterized membrane protein